jgi:hypothetical protein
VRIGYHAQHDHHVAVDHGARTDDDDHDRHPDQVTSDSKRP